MIKKLMVALAFASSLGAAQAAPILNEDFENVGELPGEGWVFINASEPVNRDLNGDPIGSWGQGDATIFPAQDDDGSDYAASGFLSVDQSDPNNQLNNYLFTPTFSAEFGALATFYLRSDLNPFFTDRVAFAFTDGSADVGDIPKTSSDIVPQGEWTLYSITLAPQGPGSIARLGFLHYGAASEVNYVGLDTLSIVTLVEPPAGVPEPASLLILGIGMAGLTVARRRR